MYLLGSHCIEYNIISKNNWLLTCNHRCLRFYASFHDTQSTLLWVRFLSVPKIAIHTQEKESSYIRNAMIKTSIDKEICTILLIIFERAMLIIVYFHQFMTKQISIVLQILIAARYFIALKKKKQIKSHSTQISINRLSILNCTSFDRE